MFYYTIPILLTKSIWIFWRVPKSKYQNRDVFTLIFYKILSLICIWMFTRSCTLLPTLWNGKGTMHCHYSGECLLMLKVCHNVSIIDWLLNMYWKICWCTWTWRLVFSRLFINLCCMFPNYGSHWRPCRNPKQIHFQVTSFPSSYPCVR